MISKNKKPPIAILGAFWSYVIYCTYNGTWYLKELEGLMKTEQPNIKIVSNGYKIYLAGDKPLSCPQCNSLKIRWENKYCTYGNIETIHSFYCEDCHCNFQVGNLDIKESL